MTIIGLRKFLHFLNIALPITFKCLKYMAYKDILYPLATLNSLVCVFMTNIIIVNRITTKPIHLSMVNSEYRLSYQPVILAKLAPAADHIAAISNPCNGSLRPYSLH
ncbi:hypothetical protein DFJ63DRAFT_312452 [Scheffersomyces coipomensis]|uniref:uncharacterized protein n=1 Tax=Scheffersomyces coipomensis TaxID=1788519 RepID=UPI00315CD49D